MSILSHIQVLLLENYLYLLNCLIFNNADYKIGFIFIFFEGGGVGGGWVGAKLLGREAFLSPSPAVDEMLVHDSSCDKQPFFTFLLFARACASSNQEVTILEC